jgi:hypothetical protein
VTDDDNIRKAQIAQLLRLLSGYRDDTLAEAGVSELPHDRRIDIEGSRVNKRRARGLAQRGDRLAVQNDTRSLVGTGDDTFQHRPDAVKIVRARNPDHIEVVPPRGQEIRKVLVCAVVHHLDRVGHVGVDGGKVEATWLDRIHRDAIAEGRHHPDQIVRADEARTKLPQRYHVVDEQHATRSVGRARKYLGKVIPVVS